MKGLVGHIPPSPKALSTSAEPYPQKRSLNGSVAARRRTRGAKRAVRWGPQSLDKQEGEGGGGGNI